MEITLTACIGEVPSPWGMHRVVRGGTVDFDVTQEKRLKAISYKT